MATENEELRKDLEAIRDERRPYANTATRIGSALLALLARIENALSLSTLKEWFLSRKSDDQAAGVIGFVQGLWVKAKDAFYIDREGNTQLNDLVARDTRLQSVVSDLLRSSGFAEAVGLAGHGFRMRYADGRATIQTDDLLVLGRMLVNTLEIREVSYIGGVYLLTPAGSKVVAVVPLTCASSYRPYTIHWTARYDGVVPDGESIAGYRLLVLADDGTTGTMNYWQRGDQAFCQTFNITEPGEYQDVSNSHWWRLVVNTGTLSPDDDVLGDGKGYHYVDVSDTLTVYLYASNGTIMRNVTGGYTFVGFASTVPSAASAIGGSPADTSTQNTVPAVSDRFVCLGSQYSTARQGAVQISAEGLASIDIYDGINNYDSLDTHTVHSLNRKKVIMSANRFEWKTYNGETRPPTVYRGEWYQGAVSQWGDEWSYQDSRWLCVKSPEYGTTTSAPGTVTDDEEDDGLSVDDVWLNVSPQAVRRWLQISPESVQLDAKGRTKTALSSITCEAWIQEGTGTARKLTEAECKEEHIMIGGVIEDNETYIDEETDIGDYCTYDTKSGCWKFYKTVAAGSDWHDLHFVWYTDRSCKGWYDHKEVLRLLAGSDGKDGKDGKDGEDGKDGHDGEDGKDGSNGLDGVNGYTVVATPSSVVLSESLDTPGSFNTQTVTFSVTGDSGVTVSDVSVTYRYNVACTRIGTTQVRVEKGSWGTSRPTWGYVTVSVSLSNGTSVSVRVPVSINWQGTIKSTIEADVQTTVASKVTSEIDSRGLLTETAADGRYVQSASEAYQELSSTIDRLTAGTGVNLFGFSKGILFTDSAWPVYPFVQGYGFETYTVYDEAIRGRVQQLGFYGMEGYYVVSCKIRAQAAVTVSVNLCGRDPIGGRGLDSNKHFAATTQWREFIGVYELTRSKLGSNFDSLMGEGGYNGFLDVENMNGDKTTCVYVRELMIERGTVASPFTLCEEDARNEVTPLGPIAWSMDKTAKNYFVEIAGGTDSMYGWPYYTNMRYLSSTNYGFVEGSGTAADPYRYGVELSAGGLTMEAGVYTMSFWAKASRNGAQMRCFMLPGMPPGSLWMEGMTEPYQSESTNEAGYTRITLTTEWKKYYVHWYRTAASTEVYLVALRIYSDDAYAMYKYPDYYQTYYQICQIEVVKGYVQSSARTVYSSVMRQTSQRMDFSVLVNALEKVGIHMYTEEGSAMPGSVESVVKGVMELIADRFRLYNSSGQQTLGVNSAGDLEVSGVMRAQSLFRSYRLLRLEGSASEPTNLSLLTLCGGTLPDVIVMFSLTATTNYINVALPSAAAFTGRIIELYVTNSQGSTNVIQLYPDVTPMSLPGGSASLNMYFEFRDNGFSSRQAHVRLYSDGEQWIILEYRDCFLQGA